MIFCFEDGADFNKGLDALVSTQEKWAKPIVVLPKEEDVAAAIIKYENSKIRFMSYDFWLTKQWLLDDNYDHIDFYRADMFFIGKSFGVTVGKATVKRIFKKKEDKR